MDPTLDALPEDWNRALAIVAHPDDLEYGAASAIARWTAQGKDITYVLATRGEAGIDSMPPDEAGPLRTREQEASARSPVSHRSSFSTTPTDSSRRASNCGVT